MLGKTEGLLAAFLAAGFVLSTAVGCGNTLDASSASPRPPGIRADTPDSGAGSLQCDAMTTKLQWDYETVRSCTHDEECNYVDGFYVPILRTDTSHYVTTLICQQRTPFLVTANGAKLAAQLGALVSDQKAQASACAEADDGTVPLDQTCRAQVGFIAQVPPICRNQICQRPG